MQLTGRMNARVIGGRRTTHTPCRLSAGVSRQVALTPVAALASTKTSATQMMHLLPKSSAATQRPGRSHRRQSVAVSAFLNKLFRSDPSEGTRKKYQARVDQVNAMEPQMQALSDEQLRSKTAELKARVTKGESLDAILPEAFAVRNILSI